MLTRSLSKLMLHSPTSTTRLVSMKTESSSGLSLDSLPNCLLLIPDEVLSHIISFLSLADIGMLCLTGSSSLKEMKDCRTGYDEWIISCKQFGVLCKRASMLCSTSIRLRLLTSWFYKLEQLECHKMDGDWAKLWGRLGLAAATSTFTLGWEDTEFGRVMGWVSEIEGEKMSVMRMFFWEFVDHEDTKASWLSFILSTFVSTTTNKESLERQAARLLFLLWVLLTMTSPSFRLLSEISTISGRTSSAGCRPVLPCLPCKSKSLLLKQRLKRCSLI